MHYTDNCDSIWFHLAAILTSISQYGAEEVEDKEVQTDERLEDMEPHKSVILHLLAQLKLGMDLTRVSNIFCVRSVS